MTNIECPGLDGANPLHFLASLGVLRMGVEAGFIDALYWVKNGKWTPGFVSSKTKADLAVVLCEGFLPKNVFKFRERLERENIRRVEIETRLQELENMGDKKSDIFKNKEALRKIKRRVKQMEKVLPNFALNCIKRRFPIITKARHLDDFCKGGLTQQQFRELALGAELPAWSLSGIAADAHLRDKGAQKKECIARTHFSFSNNNSGKELLKDFGNVAALCTPDRIVNALFGPGDKLDPITGLGWDPASQKSYALQFEDPKDGTASQSALNALAFMGLSFFSVVPAQKDRQTLGFSRLAFGQVRKATATEDNSDEVQTNEYFSWPIWATPLSPIIVSSMLGLAPLHQNESDMISLAKNGVVAAFRAKRISVNKRSYFAPSRSL